MSIWQANDDARTALRRVNRCMKDGRAKFASVHTFTHSPMYAKRWQLKMTRTPAQHPPRQPEALQAITPHDSGTERSPLAPGVAITPRRGETTRSTWRVSLASTRIARRPIARVPWLRFVNKHRRSLAARADTTYAGDRNPASVSCDVMELFG